MTSVGSPPRSSSRSRASALAARRKADARRRRRPTRRRRRRRAASTIRSRSTSPRSTQMKLIDVESGNLETLKRELADRREAARRRRVHERRGRAVRDREVAALRGVHRLRRVPERRVRPRRSRSPAPALRRRARRDRRDPASAARPRRTGARRTAAPSTSRSRPAITPACSRGSRRSRRADPIPPSAAGERAYLRGRAAYDDRQAHRRRGRARARSRRRAGCTRRRVYLRGVIRARQGEFKDVRRGDVRDRRRPPDNDKFTFVVDDRYFTIKDLARLGLGRIAHEQGEYDDAYYHYFQIPDDSRLPARRAVRGVVVDVPEARARDRARPRPRVPERRSRRSPLWPEASLLAGYVELADCKFDDSQKWYDGLVARAAAGRRRDRSRRARIPSCASSCSRRR